MIRIEEYELCGQLMEIIKRRENELKELDMNTDNSENESKGRGKEQDNTPKGSRGPTTKG